MPQKNASRMQYIPREVISDSISSNTHTLQAVNHLKLGDTVDIWEIDAVTKKRLSVIASDLTILSINPSTKKVVFSASFDTSGLTGQPIVRIDDIDDLQGSVERLYRRTFGASSIGFDVRQDILAFEADAPIAGKGLYDVDDAQFWEPGDEAQVIDDSGVIIASTTVYEVKVNADDSNNKATIAVNSNAAVNPVNNAYIQNLSLTVDETLRRIRDRVDAVDHPKKNQDVLQIPNSSHTAFEFPELFVSGSTEVYLDGNKIIKGSAGTRAALIQGTGTDELTFTSMILNTKGNDTTIEVNTNAGLTVSVSGNFKSGYTITISNDANTATAKQIADAINAHVDARRIVQVQYGSDGSGIVAAFGPSNLTGGLDDATKDYAEIEKVFENKISGTGFKWLSVNVGATVNNADPNRMKNPPQDSEEFDVGYSKASRNVDK